MNIFSIWLSFKQRDIEYKLLRDCNISNDNDLAIDIKKMKNMWALNRLFKEYKKETKMRFFISTKEVWISMFLFYMIYLFISFLFIHFGNFLLQLYFGGFLIPNTVLLFSFFIKEYYDEGKVQILDKIYNDKKKENKTVYKMIQRLNSSTEKEMIVKSVHVGKEQGKDFVKKRRL